MEKFTALKNAVLEAERDAERFYTKGNNSAGTRLRKSMQVVAQLARDVRKDVSAIRNAAEEASADAAPATEAPATPAA